MIISYEKLLKLFEEESNDSKYLGVMEEEKDEDLFDEDDLDKEDEMEIPPPVSSSIRGEDLLAKFKLKGPKAEQVGPSLLLFNIYSKFSKSIK